MITDLRINNFALIDKADIRFEPGLNVLTGETGAGKTIVLEALNLLLGKRADVSLIGPRGDEASVEAAFEAEGKELVLARYVTRAGKNKISINGHLANGTMLAEQADALVDFHGQHEHQALLKVSTHLDYLDGFAGPPVSGKIKSYADMFKKLKELEARLEKISQMDQDRISRAELTAFQAEEIERADLTPGEDEVLEQEIVLLKSSENLAKVSEAALGMLRGSDDQAGGLQALEGAASELDTLAAIDPGLKSDAERLKELAIEADDIARGISSYRQDIIFDPRRLDEAMQRSELIKTLKRKYGQTIEDILIFKDKAKQELELMQDSEVSTRDLKKQREELEPKLHAIAAGISELRHKAAGELEKTVEKELEQLNLKGCRFKVGFSDTLDLTTTGRDRVEFLLSPNVGQGLKPLAKTASGGEISRIMLALKIAFIEADPVPVLVFDEIDSGIGGETAVAVGAKLKQLSLMHQVICITHLPQIAAFGDAHYFVSKSVKEGVTATFVKSLDEDGRIEELSRMLTGGAQTEETSKRHAMELLNAARAARK